MRKKILSPYELDSSQLIGKAEEVLFPESIEKLLDIVKKTESITIRGGGSGLAGGAVPTGNTVIDLSKLDSISEFEKSKNKITVEAGVLLDELNEYLLEHNLEFPINPSSHSICTIGGMIATNAVGSRAVKYGKTSDWVLWIDTVDSKGKIERKTRTELSDFIGKEGITGIIARAGLKLSERKNRVPSIEELDSLDKIIARIKELKNNPDITMIEYIDKNVSKMIGLRENFHLFIEREIEEEIKVDSSIYEIRDRIYPKLSEKGFTRIEDPKILLDKSERILSWLNEKNIPSYGHISVGIIHPCFSKEQEKYIPELIALIKKSGGQISGEHGIGLLKKEFLDKQDIDLLKSIKKRLDPKNKFNPGKVI